MLDQLADMGSASPTELANRMTVPVSTTHDYLSTLENLGYVLANDGEYSLSARLLYFGAKMRDQSAFFQAAKPVAKELARESGEQGVVSVVEGLELIYIFTHSNNEQYELSLHPGVSVPLHVSSSGRAVLANLPKEKRERYHQNVIESDPDVRIDRRGLEEELDTIRERGWASTRYRRGTESIASPVRREGTVVGAISVGAPSNRMEHHEFRSQVIEDILDGANLIEINMMESVDP